MSLGAGPEEKYQVSHSQEITCLVVTPDSRSLITGSRDMSLKVWQLAGGKLSQVYSSVQQRKIIYNLIHLLHVPVDLNQRFLTFLKSGNIFDCMKNLQNTKINDPKKQTKTSRVEINIF